MKDKLLEITNTVLTNRGKKIINEINPDLHLRNDIGFDSLDLAEFTVRIEAEFGIDIFEDGIVSKMSEVFEKIKI